MRRSTSAFRLVRGEVIPRLAHGGGVPAPAIERFMARCQRAPSGCLEWAGATGSRGYGSFSFGGKGKSVLAHRWIYEFHKGPIPAGMAIDHLCANRRCQEISHLDICSRVENTKRYAQRLTHCRNGHSFTGNNVKVRTDGKRRCIACNRATSKRQYLKPYRPLSIPSDACPMRQVDLFAGVSP